MREREREGNGEERVVSGTRTPSDAVTNFLFRHDVEVPIRRRGLRAICSIRACRSSQNEVAVFLGDSYTQRCYCVTFVQSPTVQGIFDFLRYASVLIPRSHSPLDNSSVAFWRSASFPRCSKISHRQGAGKEGRERNETKLSGMENFKCT